MFSKTFVIIKNHRVDRAYHKNHKNHNPHMFLQCTCSRNATQNFLCHVVARIEFRRVHI